MNADADRAAQTLSFYFRTLFKKTGIPWDEAEIKDAVTNIIDAAQLEDKR